jgi:small-conductance mechanosensitive channel
MTEDSQDLVRRRWYAPSPPTTWKHFFLKLRNVSTCAHGHRAPQSLRNDPLHVIPHPLTAITAIVWRNMPKPSIAHYSHSTTHVSMLGTTSSCSWMPKGIILYVAHPNSRFFDRVTISSASGHMRRYIYIFFYFLMCFTSWVYDPAALGHASAFTLFNRSFCAPGQYFL